MTPHLNDELQQATDALTGQPLRIEHPGTKKAYFIYTEEMHQAACIAMQEQADLLAIREGIEDMEAGRVTPVAEADVILRQQLGFPPLQS